MGFLGGGNSNMFLFSPRKLGKIHILTNIFQRGWNYQLFFCATSSVFFDIGVFNGNMIIDSTRKGGGLWYLQCICDFGFLLLNVSWVVDWWWFLRFLLTFDEQFRSETLTLTLTLSKGVWKPPFRWRYCSWKKPCTTWWKNLPCFPYQLVPTGISINSFIIPKKNRKQTVFSMFFALPKGLFTDVNVQWRSVPKQRFSM